MTIKHIRKNISAENITTLFDIQIERDSSDNLTGIILTRKNFYNDDTAKNVPDSQENLLNYFYTKNEVDERIKIHMIVCDEIDDLPEEGRGNYIYLVPFENEGDHNEGLFKEYIWAEVDDGVYDYEEVGSTELDLQPILNRIDALELEKISKTSTDNGFLKSNGDVDNSGTLMTQSERNDLNNTSETVSLLIGDDGAAIINDNDAGEYTNLDLTGSGPMPQDSINRVIDETFGLLANVAWTGSYNDLNNKPINVSSFTNDAGYLTQHQDISGKANSSDLATVATSGDYEDLENKPTIPTKTSQLTNDSNFLTQHQDISGKVDKISGKGLSTNDFTDSYKNEIDNLSNNYQPKGNYLTEHQDISGKVNTSDLATVATSGEYDDLNNKPSIPTDTNDLTNGAGYITLDEVNDGVDLNNYEVIDNKSQNISNDSQSTDKYPSTKAVVDYASNLYATKTELSEAQIDPSSVDLSGYLTTSAAAETYIAKEDGKGLSTNDFTDTYKDEIDNLATNYQAKGNYLTASDISGKANSADLANIATSGSYTDLGGITTQELSITYDFDGTDVTETITFLTVRKTNS